MKKNLDLFGPIALTLFVLLLLPADSLAAPVGFPQEVEWQENWTRYYNQRCVHQETQRTVRRIEYIIDRRVNQVAAYEIAGYWILTADMDHDATGGIARNYLMDNAPVVASPSGYTGYTVVLENETGVYYGTNDRFQVILTTDGTPNGEVLEVSTFFCFQY